MADFFEITVMDIHSNSDILCLFYLEHFSKTAKGVGLASLASPELETAQPKLSLFYFLLGLLFSHKEFS
jgi:hypothetical protein